MLLKRKSNLKVLEISLLYLKRNVLSVLSLPIAFLLAGCAPPGAALRGIDYFAEANRLSMQGHSYYIRGRYGEAEPLLERSLDIWEEVFGPERSPWIWPYGERARWWGRAKALVNLALVYQAQGKYAEAEPLLERSLAIWEEWVEKYIDNLLPDPRVAKEIDNLWQVYQAQGKNDEEELLIRFEAIWGPRRLTKHLDSLAAVYEAQGKYAQAELFFKRSLAIITPLYGTPGFEDHINRLKDYASLLRKMDRENEAKEMEAHAKLRHENNEEVKKIIRNRPIGKPWPDFPPAR